VNPPLTSPREGTESQANFYGLRFTFYAIMKNVNQIVNHPPVMSQKFDILLSFS